MVFTLGVVCALGQGSVASPRSGLALHLLQDHVQLSLPLLLASPLNFFPLLASGFLLPPEPSVLFLIVDFNPLQWALAPPAPFLLVVSVCLFSWLCRPSWLIHPLGLPPACGGDAPTCSSGPVVSPTISLSGHKSRLTCEVRVCACSLGIGVGSASVPLCSHGPQF